MCKADQGTESVAMEVFVGSVKSYNSRRGFGFLTCEETERRFGRDVYLSKADVLVLGELAVGDLINFAVTLSVEGFPQAAHTERVKKGAAAAPALPQVSAGLELLEVEQDERSWATISEDTEPEEVATPTASAAGQKKAKRHAKEASQTKTKAFRWAPPDELVSSVSFAPTLEDSAADLGSGPDAAGPADALQGLGAVPEPGAASFPLVLATSPLAAPAATMVLEALPAGAQLQNVGWRCIHGGLVPATLAPELEPKPTADGCMSLCVRWPSVVHAAAYKLQVQELGDQFKGFACTTLGCGNVAIVELCLQGLTPGRTYAVSVRCIAPCGCESADSEWACLVPQLVEPAALATSPAPAMACGMCRPESPRADMGLCGRLLLA